MPFGFSQPPEPSTFLDDVDATIVDATFEEGQYGVQLNLSLLVDGASEPQHAWYSLGRPKEGGISWVILDNGKRLGGPSFKTNSKMDLLVKAMQKANFPMPDPKKGEADDSVLWLVGLKAHWNLVTMSEAAGRPVVTKQVQPDGSKTKVEHEILIPTAFLGRVKVEMPNADAPAMDDEKVAEAIVSVLEKAAKPLRWYGIILALSKDFPQAKVTAAARGQSIMEELVQSGLVVSGEEGYSIA